MKIYCPISYSSFWYSEFPKYSSGNLDSAFDNDIYTDSTFTALTNTLTISAFTNGAIADSLICTNINDVFDSITFEQTDSIGGSITGLQSYLGPFVKDINVIDGLLYTEQFQLIKFNNIVSDIEDFNLYLCESIELPNFNVAPSKSKKYMSLPNSRTENGVRSYPNSYVTTQNETFSFVVEYATEAQTTEMRDFYVNKMRGPAALIIVSQLNYNYFMIGNTMSIKRAANTNYYNIQISGTLLQTKIEA